MVQQPTRFSAFTFVLAQSFRRIRHLDEAEGRYELAVAFLPYVAPAGLGGLAFAFQQELPGVRNLYWWAFPTITSSDRRLTDYRPLP